MKGIECALQGYLSKDAEIRRTQAGREWMLLSMTVDTGGEGGKQDLTVGSWSHTIHELAPVLTADTEIYVEGKLKLRTWGGPDGKLHSAISVQATTVQPMALIGQKKPKRPRAPAKGKAMQTSAAVNQPLPFNDDISYIGV